MSDKLTAEIGRALAAELDGFKFVRAQWRILRPTNDGWQAIAINTLPTRDPKRSKLSAHAQVRIDSIEDLYAPFHPFLDERERKDHPTLVVNCDELLRDKSLARSFENNPQGIEELVRAYGSALNVDVIPWLERYSHEQEMFEGLSGDDPLEWATSDRLTRFPVLMAILAKRGDWVSFDATAREFQQYCDEPHARVYRSLATALREGIRREGQA